MIICSNCSYEMDKAVNYCPYCGEPLKNVELDDTSSQGDLFQDNIITGNNRVKAVRYINGLYEYPKAPLNKRFSAFLIDTLILFLLSVPSILLFSLGVFFYSHNDYFDGNSYSEMNMFQGVFSLWGFVLLMLPLIYFLFKDGLKNGQSFGKRVTGLMVIDIEKNTPCSIGRSIFRNFVSMLIVSVPFINLLTIWVEPIMVLVTDSGKKAADFVAKTQVIETGLAGK